MLISIIIRTFNEEKYLDELLNEIRIQVLKKCTTEVVIVDSGSTDNTLKIAKDYNARITYINQKQFTFGRSLNIGCEASKGNLLVFISGHCIPVGKSWLMNLVKPLIEGRCDYTYGRQIGRDSTKFSERQVFEKYFPNKSSIPQEGFFCNNANAAITKNKWRQYRFDEALTGLEDMYLAKKMYDDGARIGYVAESSIYHIHNESWAQVKTRYERESIALQKIMPEVKIGLLDMFNFIFVGLVNDLRVAIKNKIFFKVFISIFMFRFCQYYGAYKGNHFSRKVSHKIKMKYFYPKSGKY